MPLQYRACSVALGVKGVKILKAVKVARYLDDKKMALLVVFKAHHWLHMLSQRHVLFCDSVAHWSTQRGNVCIFA